MGNLWYYLFEVLTYVKVGQPSPWNRKNYKYEQKRPDPVLGHIVTSYIHFSSFFRLTSMRIALRVRFMPFMSLSNFRFEQAWLKSARNIPFLVVFETP